MKLLGIVTIYHPDYKRLKDSILSYIDYIDHLILWLNSPPPKNEPNYQYIISKYGEKVTILSLNENAYIAKALNMAMRWGQDNNYSHILTMDQDSIFHELSFKAYRELLDQLTTKEEYERSFFCPKVVSIGVDNLQILSSQHTIAPIHKTITSGSIYHINSLSHIGGFREEYKIDYVDFEVCCRLQLYGINGFQCNDVILLQQYGNTIKHKRWYTLNYSPIRLYYQTRNRIIFRKEYPTLSAVSKSFKLNVKLIIKILISEDYKIKKIWSIIKGYADGLSYKTYNHEQTCKLIKQ